MGFFSSVQDRVKQYNADSRAEYKDDIEQFVRVEMKRNDEKVDEQMVKQLAKIYGSVLKANPTLGPDSVENMVEKGIRGRWGESLLKDLEDKEYGDQAYIPKVIASLKSLGIKATEARINAIRNAPLSKLKPLVKDDLRPSEQKEIIREIFQNQKDKLISTGKKIDP